jgi:hypothetical protein
MGPGGTQRAAVGFPRHIAANNSPLAPRRYLDAAAPGIFARLKLAAGGYHASQDIYIYRYIYIY